MPPVALCSRDGGCNPSWPNHMWWEHRLTSTIFCTHQLLLCCNLTLPTEMPASAAARTSILKPSQHKNQRDTPWAAFTMNILGFQILLEPVIIAIVMTVVMTEPQCATQTGPPQHTLCASYLWFHCVTEPIHHVCSQPSLTQASAACMWKHPLCWHSWGAKTRDACPCQGFPRWRDLALWSHFSPCFPEKFPSILPSDMCQDYNHDLHFFSQLRTFLAGKGHHLLLPKQSQQSQWEYCCSHGLCDYSWVLRSSNSCKTDDSGPVQGLCKPAYPSLHIWAVLPQWAWYPDGQEMFMAICRYTAQS